MTSLLDIDIYKTNDGLVYTDYKDTFIRLTGPYEAADLSSPRTELSSLKSKQTSLIKPGAWSKYYIPTCFGKDNQLIVVELNLRYLDMVCVDASWEGALPEVACKTGLGPSNAWWPRTICIEAYRSTGKLPDIDEEPDPIFVCMPGATFYTDRWWFANREQICWGWAVRIMSDDMIRVVKDGSRLPLDAHRAPLSRSALKGLAG